MAFVQSPIDPNQQNQFAPTGVTSPNPLALLPPQATQTGGSSGQASVAQTRTAPSIGTPTQFGSSASRLSDYLQANQDQVQAMANQIAGQMGTQYSGLQQGINQAGQTFGGQVQAGYTPTDPTLLQQVQQNPVGVAANPEQVKSFQGQMSDQYTGPTSFEASTPYANVQQQVQNAVQQANLLGTYPGLSTYLQGNIEKNPTPGQNTLDTTLLQTNPAAWQTIQQAGQPFGGLTGYLNNTAQAQDRGVQAAEQAAQQAQQAAQGAFGNVAGGFNQQLQNELQKATSGATGFNASYNDLISRLSNTMPTGTNNGIIPLTPEQLQGIGVNQTALDQYALANKILGSYQQAPGPVNQILGNLPAASPQQLSTFLTGGKTAALPPGLASVATPQEYAESAALSTLGGNAYNPLLSPANAAQAGTYQPGGQYQKFDVNSANQLIQEVNARDQALAQSAFSGAPNIKPGDYQGLIQNMTSNPAAFSQQGADAPYILAALNRLANGFNAPQPGYTPAPVNPSLGGPVPLPPMLPGGPIVAR